MIPPLFIHLLVERGEGSGYERERDEQSDMISNNAETAIDCRERESVSDYLAEGMFSCSCVSLGEAAALQNTPCPASGAQQNHLSCLHLCTGECSC